MGWFSRDKKPTRESNQEAIQKLLADGDAAEKIINDYGGVLEVTTNMSFGAPESLLPRPKEEIKQAIRAYLLYSHLTKTLDEKVFGVLETGYSELSKFMGETDARNAAACQAAINYGTNKERTADDQVEVAKRLSSPEVTAAFARNKQSMGEYQALWYEFNSVAKKMGIPFAKSPEQMDKAVAEAQKIVKQATQRNI